MMEENFFQKISRFIHVIDPKSWPAFAMFVVVLVAAGALNYVGMSPRFGTFIAVAVAAFFGVGVLSWHVVESRTDDSEEQEQIAIVAKWSTVLFDGLLLIINFVRIETKSYGWDIAAYVIISLAAVTHVVGYLLWTEASPRRAIERELGRNLSKIKRTGNKSEAVIRATEEMLRVHKHIADEEIRLREEYKSLPDEQVNMLVNQMRRDAYAKLDELEGVKTKQLSAKETRQMRPAFTPEPRQMGPAFTPEPRQMGPAFTPEPRQMRPVEPRAENMGDRPNVSGGGKNE